MPRLTVIIPVYNSRETLQACLTAIRSSGYKDYELIVVDDHSMDGSAEMAVSWADQVVRFDKNQGSGHARLAGIARASGDILCFVDSDIVIQPATLETIAEFFEKNPDVDALTGRLDKKHPNSGFLSQYKNLYMHFIFGLLPERVTFLFGSVCAVRKEALAPHTQDLRYTPDTEFGQQLFLKGKTIAFDRDLEVVHLKKYTMSSFALNEFRVPFSWGRLFIRFGGWKQLGKNRTGFAHAPLNQLMSVMLAPVIFALLGAGFFRTDVRMLLYSLMIVWSALNARFLWFIFKEKGAFFAIKSVVLTLMDQGIMALGIMAGFLTEMIFSAKRERV